MRPKSQLISGVGNCEGKKQGWKGSQLEKGQGKSFGILYRTFKGCMLEALFFVLLWVTPDSANGLLLALCSGISAGRA